MSEPVHVIPVGAADAWVELGRALTETGPPPCEISGLPEAWWSKSPALVAEALDGCSWCRVADACLEFALRAREREGTWGGRTAAERQELAAGGGVP